MSDYCLSEASLVARVEFTSDKTEVSAASLFAFCLVCADKRARISLWLMTSALWHKSASFIRNSTISASLVNSLLLLTCTNQIFYSPVGQTEQGNLKAEKNF